MATISSRALLVSRVCSTALRRPFLHQSLNCSSSTNTEKEGLPSRYSVTKLPHRSLISIKGRDGGKLLQDLTTVDVGGLEESLTLYSMFLNAQGRVLYDVILYHRGEGDMLVECDAAVRSNIVKHLKRYALRSQVEISSDSNYDVWVMFPGKLPEEEAAQLNERVLIRTDPRTQFLGSRLLAPASTSGTEVAPNLPTSSPEDYHRHRLEVGVAEGPAEIPAGSCFPLEYNLDYLNGVSFSKGCYVGQELTARTHHTGVVRKRVVPITFDERLALEGAFGTGAKVLSDSGKNIGRLIARLGPAGLALLRVKEMNKPLTVREGSGAVEDVSVRAHTPSWWPTGEQVVVEGGPEE